MTGKLLDRLIHDAGLTSDALRLALAVERLGPGWHQLKAPALSVLLNHRGQKPIRAATLNGMERRWLDWRDGGRGGGFYRFRTPEETHAERVAAWADMGWPAPENDARMGVIYRENDTQAGVINPENDSQSGVISGGNDAQTGAIPGADGNDARMGVISGNDAPRGVISGGPHARAPYPGLEDTTTTPPTTPPARARGPEMGWLRAYLGPDAACLDRLDVSAEHPADWPALVWGWYHPPGFNGSTDGGGTQWRELVDLDPEQRQRTLATAISDFAAIKKPLTGKHFRGYVTGAANDERDKRDESSTRTDGDRTDGGGSGAGEVGRKARTGRSGSDADRASVLASLS